MKNTVFVVGAIVIKDGKALAVKRGDSKNKAVAYKYEFAGGKIEPGETCEQALKRELLEEMDYDVEVQREFMRVVYEYDEIIVDLRAFICAPLSDTFALKEHIDAVWLDGSHLFDVEWAPADYDIIKELEKLLNR